MRGTIWRLLKLVVPFAGWIVLATVLGFLAIGSSIGLMATAAFLIASAALHPSVADLAIPIVGVRFFGISRGAFRYLERYVSHNLTFRLLTHLRVWFYEAVEPLAPARLMQYRSGDLLSRVIADVETLEHFFVRVIAPPAVATLVGLTMWVFMRQFDLRLAYTLLAFLLLSGVGLPLVVQRLSSHLEQQTVQVRSELHGYLVDGIQGLADLVAFGGETRQFEQIRGLGQTWAATQGRSACISALHSAMGGLLTNLGLWSVLVVAIPLVSAGRLDGVYLPVLALAALASFEAVSPLPLALQHLAGSLESAHRLFEMIDARPATQDPAGSSPSPADYGLVIDHLQFRYHQDERPALDGISFRLPPGSGLAVVGPSGAGKSTLVHLLLRFWDYTEGQILLGGHDLRMYRAEDVRAMIGVVMQTTHLFNATIRENLLIARPGASDADLIWAAEQAQLHQFVQTLPKGYDTWIGEQGLLLSAGERQRVAIARAFLKNAPILILDEAIANLDSITERRMRQALRALMKDRTTLIVTHNLRELEEMDEVLVLQAGKVIERGLVRELLQTDGLFRRMWERERGIA